MFVYVQETVDSWEEYSDLAQKLQATIETASGSLASDEVDQLPTPLLHTQLQQIKVCLH